MVVTDILNSHQNRSKNKLVGENGVTRVSTWKLLAPGYGLLISEGFSVSPCAK